MNYIVRRFSVVGGLCWVAEPIPGIIAERGIITHQVAPPLAEVILGGATVRNLYSDAFRHLDGEDHGTHKNPVKDEKCDLSTGAGFLPSTVPFWKDAI